MAENLKWALWMQMCLLYVEVPGLDNLWVPLYGQLQRMGKRVPGGLEDLRQTPFHSVYVSSSTNELDHPWD